MCWVPLLALLATPVAGAGQGASAELSANPVRKVVTLLQKMQTSVEAEGDREKELYDRFMCYCTTNKGSLEKSIADAGAKIEQLTADTEASEAEKAKTVETLDEAKQDRADAKAAMQAATGMREKEAAAFSKFQADSVANIGAIVKAVAALEKGVAGAFLQTSAAGTLKNILSDVRVSMPDYDRQQVMSFLSGNPFSQGYASQSDSIIGILKQMGDEMATALAEATHEEEKAIHIYNELVAAKTDEVNALTKMIEDKLQKNGELGVMIAEMKNDLGDTTELMAEDKKFLSELETGCSSKTAEWEARCKVRQQELLALAETIKLLNDDDALELFKKTLPPPSASFLEVRMSAATVRSRARAILEQAGARAGRGNSMIAFIEYALSGKKIGFEKVITMIDEMVATLKKEQDDDDSKKEYCSSELDTSDDKKKSLEKHISDTEAGIASTEEAIATTTQDIAELTATIKALDEQVMAATEQRKEENADYKQLMTDDAAAKELLKLAMNRLNKFYNPKLYVPPAKVERSTMTAISEDMAFAQIAIHGQKAAPPPPPETFGAYAKKTEEHGGVVQMMGLLIADLDKEMTEAETQEKDSQADYAALMKESAEKRAADSKSLSDKQSAKADLEVELQKLEGTLKEGKREMAATLKYIADLHVECDWLLKYYAVRKEMRASEVDALGKARAVLSGADYSLL